MKSKIAIIILVLIALSALLFLVTGCGSREETRLVPAWQLTPDGVYDSESMKDPVMSWSPDSRSLLFAAVGAKSYRASIFQWNVGEKKLAPVTGGSSPNYVDNDTLLFFKINPRGVYERNLKTGQERQIAPRLHELDVWRDLSAVSYNPVRKTLELRYAGFTRYYEPGCQEADMTGKYLGNVCRTTGGGVLDRSSDPKGEQSAVILGDLTGTTRELRISKPGKETKGKIVATGDLGAVAWSPDGRVVAFADGNTVKELSPSSTKLVTIARLGQIPESGDPPYVCRLLWSPDGNYLAVVELVPADASTFEMVYVLDMSKMGR